MTERPFAAADYPIAETAPERVTGKRGRSFDDLTLDAAISGDLAMEDLRITETSLLRQAQIARSVGRAALAENFERAAEMTRLPQDEIMAIYELLRPGRAASKDALADVADRLRQTYRADRLAAFVEKAAQVYDSRGLYQTRY